MRTFLCLLLCGLLSACGSPGVPSDYKLDPSGKNGLVVGTLTYSSFTGKFSVIWAPVSGDQRFVASVGFSQWPPLGPEYDDALKAKGGTFAIEVPAGEYKLTGWSLRQGATTYSAARPIDIPFVVAAGKVTYLGNFHYHRDDVVSLDDKATRDMPILRDRFAAVKASTLAFALAEGAKFESLGGGMNKRFDTPIFVPVFVR